MLLDSSRSGHVDFWMSFPCPPPWNKELFFKVNWTGCLGLPDGCQVRNNVAQRCHIEIKEQGECTNYVNVAEVTRSIEACNGQCKLLVIVGLLIIVVVALTVVSCFMYRFLCRKKSHGSPSHLTALRPNTTSTFYSGTQFQDSAKDTAEIQRAKPEVIANPSTVRRENNSYNSLGRPCKDNNRSELTLPISASFSSYKKLSEDTNTPSPNRSPVSASTLHECVFDDKPTRKPPEVSPAAETSQLPINVIENYYYYPGSIAGSESSIPNGHGVFFDDRIENLEEPQHYEWRLPNVYDRSPRETPDLSRKGFAIYEDIDSPQYYKCKNDNFDADNNLYTYDDDVHRSKDDYDYEPSGSNPAHREVNGRTAYHVYEHPEDILLRGMPPRRRDITDRWHDYGEYRS